MARKIIIVYYAMTSKYNIVDWFSTNYGIEFKRVSGDEYASTNGCPWCGSSSGVSDRFHVWEDKQNFWCRQCGKEGFLDTLTQESHEITDHERRIRELEVQQRMMERQQAEHDRRLTALEKIHGMMANADYYHKNLTAIDNNAFEYWISEGILCETIDKYKLGYCSRCPTDSQRRPSYTIPVIIHDKLFNIRHRLIQADNGDKYRPEIPGLPNVLFNADNLYGDSETIIIAEGEKKAIHLTQLGFPNVGMMGKSGFKPEWVGKFHRFSTVYIALDPDAEAQAVQIAELFQGRGRVVSMPDKVDDMVTQYGATYDDIEWFIKRGVPV